MVKGAARIDTLEDGRAHLRGLDAGSGSDLVVVVRSLVPAWLEQLGREATEAGVRVLVAAEPPAALAGEALDGWEIGVCTAALAAGAADVEGIARTRVARVREVGDLLAAHAPSAASASVPAPEAAS